MGVSEALQIKGPPPRAPGVLPSSPQWLRVVTMVWLPSATLTVVGSLSLFFRRGLQAL